MTSFRPVLQGFYQLETYMWESFLRLAGEDSRQHALLR